MRYSENFQGLFSCQTQAMAGFMYTAKPRREAIKTKRFIISPLKGCKEVDISFITL